jgi:hypothetical protein
VLSALCARKSHFRSICFSIPTDTFSVVAVNAAGRGAASAASSPLLRSGVLPSAPRFVASWPGKTAVSVSFAPPLSTGDGAVGEIDLFLFFLFLSFFFAND